MNSKRRGIGKRHAKPLLHLEQVIRSDTGSSLALALFWRLCFPPALHLQGCGPTAYRINMAMTVPFLLRKRYVMCLKELQPGLELTTNNCRLVIEDRLRVCLLPSCRVLLDNALTFDSAGIEPFAVATAAALPKLRHHYPVEVGHNNISAETIFSNSGNLAPPRSASFGLPHASERIPDHCQLDQVQILHRHGQRYPTGGFETEAFADKIKAAGSNLQASGAMAFLMDWEYPLGAEILTPAGRLQLFQLGTSMRFKYGGLLDKMRSLSHLPVFRTTSQDRMLHSALNFAAGFFGIPYEDQYRQEVIIEEKGGKHNNTLVSQHNCPNEGRSVNRLGLDKGFEWVERSLSGTAQRLQDMVRSLTCSQSIALR